ncbi:MAG: PAS domain S-box protein [Deltaproteobacteria bacterium]|nr:PAS domain S-box protein [Deltaproteobacteria bacterium]
MKKEQDVSRLVRRNIIIIYIFILLGLILVSDYSLVYNEKIGALPAAGLILIFLALFFISKKTAKYVHGQLLSIDKLRLESKEAFEMLKNRAAELESSQQAALIMAKDADAKALIIEKERENLRTVFDSVKISMVLVDENIKIAEANRAAGQMLDSDFPEMLNIPFGNGLCCIHALNSPGGCGTSEVCANCLFREIITTVFKTGKPIHDMNIRKQFLFNGKETTRWLEVNASPLMLRGIHYVLLSLNNITARKQAEEQVLQSEEKFRNMTDLLPEAVFECDLNGILTFANRALFYRFGYNNDDFKSGIYIFQLVSTDERKKVSDAFTGFVKAWDMDKSEYTALKKDGSTFPVIMYSTPILLDAKPCAVRGIIADVSELKQKEAELELAKESAESANKTKSAFLANMSHEIRTPLNVMMGATEILEQSGLAGENRNLVEMLRANGDVLLKIINDIIDISKIEAGKIDLEHIEFNVSSLIEKTCASFESSAHKSGIELKRRIDQDLPQQTAGDPVRIQQVLINLIGNALKFTYHGHITVGCWFMADTAEFFFSVADTGIGLDDDKRETIFESFSQADTSTTRKFGGTGLGLSISKHLVELMGGRIWVESVPGQGCTFYFTFPHVMVSSENVNPGLEENEKINTGKTGLSGIINHASILLVDDYPYNQEIISYFLKGLPIDIDLASNGAVAVEKFKAKQYDLVLMDLQMPVMDGYTATRAMRKIEKNRDAGRTPVIALSAFVLKKERDKSREAGCDAHLNKPVKRENLIDTIAKFLSMEKAETGLTEHNTVEKGPERESEASGDPVVYAEQIYEKLIPRYLDDLRKDASSMESLLKTGGYDGIRKMGHNIKGSGGGYGFNKISEIGKALESAAKDEDRRMAENGVKALLNYLNQVKVVYR